MGDPARGSNSELRDINDNSESVFPALRPVQSLDGHAGCYRVGTACAKSIVHCR